MVDQVRIRVATQLPKVRARVLPSLLPTQIELRNTGTDIQWRYIDGVSGWTTLIAVIDLLPTAADILAKLLTVDGAGSGLDADLLDGLDSTAFEVVSKPSVTVTATGTTAIAATDRIVVVNLASPGNVTLTLPTLASRSGASLRVIDLGGNATITITPNGAETIMGLASATLASAAQGLGTAASVLLLPNAGLSAWLA